MTPGKAWHRRFVFSCLLFACYYFSSCTLNILDISPYVLMELDICFIHVWSSNKWTVSLLTHAEPRSVPRSKRIIRVLECGLLCHNHNKSHLSVSTVSPKLMDVSGCARMDQCATPRLVSLRSILWLFMNPSIYYVILSVHTTLSVTVDKH